MPIYDDWGKLTSRETDKMAWWNDDMMRWWHGDMVIVVKSFQKVVERKSIIAKSCHKLPNVVINCQKFLKAMVNCLNLPNVVKTLPKFQNKYNWMLKGTEAENNLPKDTKS